MVLLSSLCHCYSQRVQVSLWYILIGYFGGLSIYHSDTWSLWDCQALMTRAQQHVFVSGANTSGMKRRGISKPDPLAPKPKMPTFHPKPQTFSPKPAQSFNTQNPIEAANPVLGFMRPKRTVVRKHGPASSPERHKEEAAAT